MHPKHFFVFAFMSIVGSLSACQAATEDADQAGGNAALTDSVQDARLKRIKAAYEDAVADDFKSVPAPVSTEELAATVGTIDDPRWFTLKVDDENVYILDFVGAWRSNTKESLVVIFEHLQIRGRDGRVSDALAAALVYRAGADEWVVVRDQWKASPMSADGGGGDAGNGGDASDGGDAGAAGEGGFFK